MAVLAAAMLGACPPARGGAVWTIAGYLAGDGDLAEEAKGYLDQISRGAAEAGWNAAVQIDLADPAGVGTARRHLWLQTEDGRRHVVQAVPGAGTAINMGDGETLAQFLRWVRGAAPAERYALIVMGHGLSVAGDGGLRGGLSDSGVALDATCGGDTLTARELREALLAVAPEGEGPWLDAIFLDCCFGGSLEVAYELRDAARWLCGSPGEMQSPGVPWDGVLACAGRQGVMDGRGLVAGCLSAAAREAAGGLEVRLTAVDLSRVAEVGATVRRLSGLAAGEMARLAPSVTLARSQCRTWGKGRELCDAAQFASALAEGLGTGEVAEAARAVAEAVAECVTGGEGPALFLPGLLGEMPADYVNGELSLATEGGWGEFVAAYVSRLRDLMGQTAEDAAGAGTDRAG